jgi:tRNA(Leu) C34 or U34 (ribose-2'-O)-methylase TrmL
VSDNLKTQVSGNADFFSLPVPKEENFSMNFAYSVNVNLYDRLVAFVRLAAG